MMEDEFVRRRQWLTRERFLDLFGTANLLPGPTSTELALLLGRERGGFLGLLLAGAGFILPAFICVVAIAVFMASGGQTPAFSSALRGMQPVIVAIVAHAVTVLARTAFKSPFLICCALVAGTIGFFRPDFILLILLGTGVLSTLARTILPPKKSAGALALFVSLLSGKRACAEQALAAAATAAPLMVIGIWQMFWYFLKIGAVFYGSGYVIYSFLHDAFVARHLITEQQLANAITVGQITPGPFFTSGAFVGYQLHGVAGAVLATVGMFGPAFVYAIFCGPLITRVRKAYWARAFLDGVNAASCALMLVVCWQLGRGAMIDWKTIALFVVSLGILVRFKINSAWLVLGGAAIGWAAL
jgi:chromate transporter